MTLQCCYGHRNGLSDPTAHPCSEFRGEPIVLFQYFAGQLRFRRAGGIEWSIGTEEHWDILSDMLGTVPMPYPGEEWDVRQWAPAGVWDDAGKDGAK